MFYTYDSPDEKRLDLTPLSDGEESSSLEEEDQEEGASPDEQRMELTPLSDGEKSSEEEEDQEEDASPDEQRLELTPPSEDEHTETGSSSTSAESASTREVTRVQSEQAHKYMTRSRAKLLRNKT